MIIFIGSATSTSVQIDDDFFTFQSMSIEGPEERAIVAIAEAQLRKLLEEEEEA